MLENTRTIPNSHNTRPRDSSRENSQEELGFASRYILLSFLAFTVVPVFRIPLFDVSIAAPAMFLIALEVLQNRLTTRVLNLWNILAALIWLSMVGSLWVNTVLGTAKPDVQILNNIFRYLYWMVTFLVMTSLMSNANTARQATTLMSLAIIILAGIRAWEAINSSGWGIVNTGASPSMMTKNVYGIQFSTFALFVLPLMFSTGMFRWRFVSALTSLLLAIVVLGNASRSGWIALAVGLSLFAAIHVLTDGSKWYLWLLPAATLLVFNSFVPLPADLEEVVNYQLHTFEDLETDESYAFRQAMNERNWRIFSANPLLGVGFGQSYEVSVADLDIPRRLRGATAEDFLNRSPHNSYLVRLADMGLVGMAPYVFLLGVLTLRGFVACISLARRKEFWAIGAYCSFIAMSIHLWSLSGLGSTGPWIIYGLVAGMIELDASDTTSNELALTLNGFGSASA